MEEFETTLRALYKEYADKFYAAAYSILQNREDAEDAVGETFVRLIENRDVFLQIPEEKRLSYVKKTVKNLSLDMIRKRNRHGDTELTDDISFDGISVEENAEGKDAYVMLVDCINAMSDSLKQALYLRVNYCFSTKEIARTLGISESAARKRLSDAQKQIRNFMEVNNNE